MLGHSIDRWLLPVLFAVVFACSSPAIGQTDPLPSWNDGATKTAIVSFVKKVTTQGSPDFVAPAERIAVFDNDGTLWAEQPYYFQLAFAMDEIKRLAPSHPEWKTTEPYRAVLAGDTKGLATSGKNGLVQIMAVTHAGMTTQAFAKSVADWLASAQHPTKHRPYTELVYQPQLELLAYLRDADFKTYIVSGGGVEFMRVFAEKVYGIPPEQVVGSSGEVIFRLDAQGKPELKKNAKNDCINDGPGKPLGINRFIGRQPIFAFGNSDGDQQMLEYTMGGSGARLVALLHHTDAEREWAYDRKSRVGKLDKAWDEALVKGWLLVDMKADWKTVFPADP